MQRTSVLSLAAWAVPVMFVTLGSVPAQAQSGPREAPTGFDGRSNGFAEEFCANQRALTNSPNSPEIPADECFFEAAVAEFTGPETTADGLGWDDDVAFARHLVETVGVAVVPGSSFYRDPADGRRQVRFAFCKKDETLDEAERRLSLLVPRPR